MRNKGGGTIELEKTLVTSEETSSARADATVIDPPRKRASRAPAEKAAAAKGKEEAPAVRVAKAAPAKRVSKAPPARKTALKLPVTGKESAATKAPGSSKAARVRRSRPPITTEATTAAATPVESENPAASEETAEEAPVAAAEAASSTEASSAETGAPSGRVAVTLASVAPKAEDQISIPPAWSQLGDHDEPAFKDASHDVRTSNDGPERLPVALPPAPLRRPTMEKYIKAAIGFAAVVGLAALVRAGVARLGHAPEHTAAAATVNPPAPSIPPPPPVVEETAPPVAAAPAKSAAEEKKGALAALEQRKLDDAIAAGERAVDLAPEDGEAWLILGAAYQDSGRFAEARHAYAECTKQAKTGNIRECAFLLAK
jgi:hypothetical protein